MQQARFAHQSMPDNALTEISLSMLSQKFHLTKMKSGIKLCLQRVANSVNPTVASALPAFRMSAAAEPADGQTLFFCQSAGGNTRGTQGEQISGEGARRQADDEICGSVHHFIAGCRAV